MRIPSAAHVVQKGLFWRVGAVTRYSLNPVSLFSIGFMPGTSGRCSCAVYSVFLQDGQGGFCCEFKPISLRMAFIGTFGKLDFIFATRREYDVVSRVRCRSLVCEQVDVIGKRPAAEKVLWAYPIGSRSNRSLLYLYFS